jgi:hypothetical protein
MEALLRAPGGVTSQQPRGRRRRLVVLCKAARSWISCSDARCERAPLAAQRWPCTSSALSGGFGLVGRCLLRLSAAPRCFGGGRWLAGGGRCSCPLQGGVISARHSGRFRPRLQKARLLAHPPSCPSSSLAFWLRSCVVSVLIKLKLYSPPIGRALVLLSFCPPVLPAPLLARAGHKMTPALHYCLASSGTPPPCLLVLQPPH